MERCLLWVQDDGAVEPQAPGDRGGVGHGNEQRGPQEARRQAGPRVDQRDQRRRQDKQLEVAGQVPAGVKALKK